MDQAVERSWTALVVTTRSTRDADAIASEVLLYQKRGFIAQETILLTINDPWSDVGAGVGSGGATINALLYTVEHICASRGYQVLSPDVLADSSILIIHHGRPYPFGCSSRAMAQLPRDAVLTDRDFAELETNFLHLLNFVTQQLLTHFDHGLWICSSDMLMKYDLKLLGLQPYPRSGQHDACIVTVSAEKAYATRHGVVIADEKGLVADILYAAPIAQLEQHVTEDTVALVSGIVYLSVRVAEQLLTLISSPILECCTYIGHDTGLKPVPISLFFDMLLAMCNTMTESNFMQRGLLISRTEVCASGAGDGAHEASTKVRRLIWDHMRQFRLTSVQVLNAKHIYLSLDLRASDHLKELDDFDSNKISHSIIANDCQMSNSICAINSWLLDSVLYESSCFVNCYLDSSFRVQRNVFVCNVDTRITYCGAESMILKSGLCLQTFPVGLKSQDNRVISIPVAFGISDFLLTDHRAPSSTYCNMPWKEFFQITGIGHSDLWPAGNVTQNLWNAKLYPVPNGYQPTLDGLFWAFESSRSSTKSENAESWKSAWRFSLDDIFRLIDVKAEFAFRRCLFYDILGEQIRQKLSKCDDFSFRAYFNSAVIDKQAEHLLTVLDSVASLASPGIAARTLALIADLLGAMANGQGGLRSGPAANMAFSKAFSCLENEHISHGVDLMAKERPNWTHRPDMIIRCARHYEAAAQICIRKAVASAKQFISVHQRVSPRPSTDIWYTVTCPARIDLSGGWTDTPPIAYEHGGLVINAALLINGGRPIGAKVRRTDRNYSIKVTGDTNSSIHLCENSNLLDFCLPNAPGALVKCCILFANIIDLQSQETLSDQLRLKWGCGLEIASWSNLPQGSGLGTSSILAGALIAALWRALGQTFNNDSVVHAVLCIEQMLTTGGGWQDQVGGVYGGFKAGSSATTLPLLVQTQLLKVDPTHIDEFNSRILLFYTGRPRLAKNLLQNVVRNWYAREPGVVSTCVDLKTNAERCRKAFETWDFETICSCITGYYEQKKRMAAGTEPAAVRDIIEVLQPYICAHTLAGAGGGGFLFCLLKDPKDREAVENLLPAVKGSPGSQIFSASVDLSGIHFSDESVA